MGRRARGFKKSFDILAIASLHPSNERDKDRIPIEIYFTTCFGSIIFHGLRSQIFVEFRGVDSTNTALIGIPRGVACAFILLSRSS
jgi:hypothetical protein